WYPVGLLQNPLLASSWPAIPGAIFLTLAGIALPFVIRGLRAGGPEAFLSALFVAVAVGSALVTAWGRGAGGYGLATSEASRYTIFGDYMSPGLLYWYVPQVARRWTRLAPSKSRGLVAIFCSFLVASAVNFWRALPDYQTAVKLNRTLAVAY